jgi:hypothetical protein
MAWFSNWVPRLPLLALALVAFGLISPETLSRGPQLCLWRHLFHLSACPACGTTRALAAFFHGHFAQALVFNRNILVTAPCLISLLTLDLFHLTRRFLSFSGRRTTADPTQRLPSRLYSPREANKFFTIE